MTASHISNQFIPGLKNENIGSVDFAYVLNHPIAYLRIGGFFSDVKNNSQVISFYHDDLNSIVNYAMPNINQRYMGIELSTDIRIGKMFSVLLSGTFGDYQYTNDPNLYVATENGAVKESVQKVNQKGLHKSGTT